jgi:OFA family oxalate/formate antiporter-like MFS transporter
MKRAGRQGGTRHAPVAGLLRNRWVQLAAGIVAMIAVANLQYGWTLFVTPIQQKFGWSYQDIQIAFTLFVLAETWLVPVEARLAERFGPCPLVLAGGVLVALAWAVNSAADTLGLLYLGAVLGGVGAGIVYGVSIGSALKWFPDRRGLAAGLTAAAFGGGSALTVVPIHNMIRDSGYQAAFLYFGLIQGAVVFLAALVMRSPTAGELLAPRGDPRVLVRPARDFTPTEVLRTPAFWLMYAMFTMVASGGLLATAQLEPMSRHYGVKEVEVTVLGFTMAALPFAMQLDRVLNGAARPFFGWVSDRIGREQTMFLAFAVEGGAILLLLALAHVPIWFVLLSGLTFFAWGEIYSLFPATCGDLFGRKYATTNYALLYTAKGTAALLVPVGSLLRDATGSWVPIFALAVAFNWLTALLALFVLRPLRQRMAVEGVLQHERGCKGVPPSARQASPNRHDSPQAGP